MSPNHKTLFRSPSFASQLLKSRWFVATREARLATQALDRGSYTARRPVLFFRSHLVGHMLTRQARFARPAAAAAVCRVASSTCWCHLAKTAVSHNTCLQTALHPEFGDGLIEALLLFVRVSDLDTSVCPPSSYVLVFCKVLARILLCCSHRP